MGSILGGDDSLLLERLPLLPLSFLFSLPPPGLAYHFFLSYLSFMNSRTRFLADESGSGNCSGVQVASHISRALPLPISSRNCTSSGLKEAIEMDLT